MADITGFHQYARKTAENVMALVLELHSQYVSLLEEISKSTKGTVIFIIGDRVMLAWNATIPCASFAQQVPAKFRLKLFFL